MMNGKVNVLLDCYWGSSGKGKTSAYLADRHGVTHVSSSNFPNAGHTVAFEDGTKFVAKAIPTAAALRRAKGIGVQCFITPGSGFSWRQLFLEWHAAGQPEIFVHSRASVVTAAHKERESAGGESTRHIASTMQGSATAMVDKILRRADCELAGTRPLEEVLRSLVGDASVIDAVGPNPTLQDFLDRVRVVDAWDFRTMVHEAVGSGSTWLHEGSQGYALSIDHGSHFPHCTSRNCTVQAAMDHLSVPPQLVGDVYLNLRTFPIRVGNVHGDAGEQLGYSGDFYPDCQELSWEEVARRSGMPESEARVLAERERTTVTKRVRRVSTFSHAGLRDAVRVNGATQLVMNFIQYVNWQDNGKRGGRAAFDTLSRESREFIDRAEQTAGIPVTLVGTGALHEDMIDLSLP